MSQALYRKWRPARFDDVVGQEHITRTLQQAVASQRVGHAYLFCGPRGTGKTTSARLLAKAVNCLHENPAQRPCGQCAICQAVSEGRFLDLIEIDAASNTGVDDMRDLRDKINFSPSQGRMKIYIIDEVHMLSTAAFNALLKTLEEPPAHAMFVLATTEEHKVPITIKSRCQQFNFRLLTIAEISERLAWLAEREGLLVEPLALDMIARQGAGSLRDSESLLDQLVVAPGDTITLERAQMVLGTASNTAVMTLTDAWLNSDGVEGLRIIHQSLASGTDARQFCRQMVDYLRQLLLLQAAGGEIALDVPVEQKDDMLAQARLASRTDLVAAVRRFNEAAMTPANSWQPQLPLELAFIEMLPDKPFVARSAPVVREQPQPEKKEVVPEKVVEKTAVSSPPAPVQPEPSPPRTAEPLVTTRSTMPPPPEEPPDFFEETLPTRPAAPSPAKPKPEPVPPSAPVKTIALVQVTQQWREFMSRVGQANRNFPALLNMSKPLAVEGQAVVLGFDYAIFKKKFDDTPGAAHAVADILSELLQTRCTVRCVVTSEYNVPISRQELESLADELGGVVREID
ncbi:MAG: DNA polymerase III subunit gamma/tau [Ardenticatenaceae bacterium]|nr:DNA polymerase III subunit gamma/tau [Ardenticatenaceae bacterium]